MKKMLLPLGIILITIGGLASAQIFTQVQIDKFKEGDVNKLTLYSSVANYNLEIYHVHVFNFKTIDVNRASKNYYTSDFNKAFYILLSDERLCDAQPSDILNDLCVDKLNQNMFESINQVQHSQSEKILGKQTKVIVKPSLVAEQQRINSAIDALVNYWALILNGAIVVNPPIIVKP